MNLVGWILSCLILLARVALSSAVLKHCIEFGVLDQFRIELGFVHRDDAQAFTGLLHLVAHRNKIDPEPYIDLLLAKGLDINSFCQDSRKETALLVSSKSGNIRAFKYLLGHGANFHTRNENWRNPLMVALMNHHEEVVDILIDAYDAFLMDSGDPENFRFTFNLIRDRFGDGIIHKAVTSMVRTETILRLINNLGLWWDLRDSDNQTPLMRAYRLADLGRFEAFLGIPGARATLESVDCKSSNILCMVINSHFQDKACYVRLLLKYGEKTTVSNPFREGYIQQAIGKTCACEVIKELLIYDAPLTVDAQFYACTNVIEFAKKRGYPREAALLSRYQIFKLLLSDYLKLTFPEDVFKLIKFHFIHSL